MEINEAKIKERADEILGEAMANPENENGIHRAMGIHAASYFIADNLSDPQFTVEYVEHIQKAANLMEGEMELIRSGEDLQNRREQLRKVYGKSFEDYPRQLKYKEMFYSNPERYNEIKKEIDLLVVEGEAMDFTIDSMFCDEPKHAISRLEKRLITFRAMIEIFEGGLSD